MKLTSDPGRIERAHRKLQYLEDDIVGSMNPTNKESVEDVERVFRRRLEIIRRNILSAIYDLNEAYDGKPLPATEESP